MFSLEERPDPKAESHLNYLQLPDGHLSANVWSSHMITLTRVRQQMEQWIFG